LKNDKDAKRKLDHLINLKFSILNHFYALYLSKNLIKNQNETINSLEKQIKNAKTTLLIRYQNLECFIEQSIKNEQELEEIQAIETLGENYQKNYDQSLLTLEEVKKTNKDQVLEDIPKWRRNNTKVIKVFEKIDQHWDQIIDNASEQFEEHYKKDKKNIQTHFKKFFETIKNNYLENVGDIYNNLLNVLKKLSNNLENMSDAILELDDQLDDSVLNHTLLDYLKFSTLDHEQSNKNIRIVGGCGVHLSTQSPQLITDIKDEHLEETSTLIKKVKAEKLYITTLNKKDYTVFKLPVKDHIVLDNRDHTDLLLSLGEVENPMVEEDIEAFQTILLKQDLEIDEDNEEEFQPKFNLERKDNEGRNLIHYSAELKNATVLKTISKNIDKKYLHQPDKNGYYPIHIAASINNVEVITFIANKIKDAVNTETPEGFAPLMLAAQGGHTKTVSTLLTLNAKVNLRLPNGLFALYLAIQNKHNKTALTLIEEGTEIELNFTMDNGSSALHLAIDLGLEDVALALIQKGADVTLKRKADGYTPLHCAADKGLEKVLHAIMRTNKIAVDTPIESGKTPLHLAVINGHEFTVKTLVEVYEHDTNVLTQEKQTPLMLSIEKNQKAISLYLAKKTSIGLTNTQKQSTLVMASLLNQFELADELLKQGEDPLLTDESGHNYVFYLVRQGQYARYKYLINTHDIDPNLTFNEVSSISLAIKWGHLLIATYLIKQKVEYDYSDWMDLVLKTDNIGILKKEIKQSKNFKPVLAKHLAYLAAKKRQ
jgi:ankyrin repeat protein